MGVALLGAERVSVPETVGEREGGRERLSLGVPVIAALEVLESRGDLDAEAQGDDELEARGVADAPGDSDAAMDAEAETESEGEGELEVEPLPEREMVGVTEPLPVALGDAVDVALLE